MIYLYTRIKVGDIFDRLIVIGKTRKSNKLYWKCKCSCGSDIETTAYRLTHSLIRSCGCLRKEITSSNFKSDLIGKRFDMLVVIGELGRTKNQQILWRCKCDCGKETVVKTVYLTHGDTTSCGCKCGEKHNMTGTSFYNTWSKMKSRCFNKINRDYQYYGARGITVCERWKDSFLAFKEDMYESYLDHIEKYGEKDTSIDRIDVNGNHCKENCRWATQVEQANNKRNQRKIDGLSIREFADKHGLKYRTVLSRCNRGYYDKRTTVV